MSSDAARYLDAGGRLAAPPSAPLVRAFSHELEYAGFLFEGMSYADLAHVLMLVEQGVVPEQAGRELLGALVDLHEGGLQALALDAKWGDLYNNRDAELQRRLGDAAGWLHAGRARREALTVAWLLHVREAATALLRQTLATVETMADRAEGLRDAIMPDFTYLQHAQPTTLGHYLLGFAYPLLRDAERLWREWHLLDESPAGSASTNGSRLPLQRDRLRELLGFERLTVHNRDAMWRSDVPINLMAVVVSLTTGASRLAEDLQIWATAEFAFIDLADEHCRTSVIMPNKKNPYALTFIRGQARELDGGLVSVVTTNQTPSGQIDNRNTSYNVLPRALASGREVVGLLGDVLVAATFDTMRLRRQAEEGFTFGTELTDLLLQREGIDSRRAHEIVGTVVAGAADGGAQEVERVLRESFAKAVGRPLRSDFASLWEELGIERIVANRSGEGSCAPAAVAGMCTSLRARCAELRGEVDAAMAASEYPSRLRRAVAARLGREW